jgi:predicted nucleic acid-binding protein
LKLAVDSSAFAKRYVKEPGSEELDAFLQNASELGLCMITLPEIVSALNRRRREGALSDKDMVVHSIFYGRQDPEKKT